MTTASKGKIDTGKKFKQINAARPTNDKFPESSQWLFEPLKQDIAIKGEKTIDTTISNGDNWWDSLLIVAIDPYEWTLDSRRYSEECEQKLERYHVELLDRAAALNDNGLVVDPWGTISGCQRLGVKMASFSILTPIEISRDKWGFRENYYEKLQINNKWSMPDGKIAEDPFNAGGSKSFQGLIMLESDLQVKTKSPINEHVYMCFNSPYWLDYQVRTAVESLDAGIDAIDMDNIIRVPFLHGHGKSSGCFCSWCEKKFCEYLQKKDPQLWEDIQHQEQQDFSCRSYFGEKFFDIHGNLKGNYSGNPYMVYREPLLKHFLLFQTESYMKFFSEYQQRIKAHSTSRGRIAPIFGNLYVGVQDHILGVWQPASALLSQYCDMIQIEACPPLPPLYRQSVIYELGTAFGNNKKPVLLFGVPGNGFLKPIQNHQAHYFENLQKISVSQAYSKGGIRELRTFISRNAWNIFAKNGTIDAEKFFPSTEYINFVHNNRDIFLQQTSVSKVGVVYSIPSFLWHNYPLFGIHPDKNAKAFVGIARMLEDLHIPYDVIILGCPGYWDDSNLLSRIDNFNLLFFPEVDCLSPEQCRAILQFLQAGGTAVYTGYFCLRDASFNPMVSRDAQLLRNYSKRLYIDPTLYTRDRTNFKMSQELQRFQEFLTKKSGLDLGISVNAPTDVELNVYKHKSSNLLIFHLNNYSYNIVDDTVTPHSDLTFTINWPRRILIDEISIMSPDDIPKGRILYSMEDAVLQFTIPKLHIWNIILVRYHESTTPNKIR